MCGFFFYISKKDLDKKKIKFLDNSANLLKHRGPDNNQKFINGKIYARHYRLSILDIKDRSNQPFFSNDKRYMLLFNGEIYNFDTIKKELKKDYNFKTKSDTEVLLAAFIKYKEKVINKVAGMFSFLVYDFKLKKIYIFRDPFGQKPLYYHIDKGSILISSEIKPIYHLKSLKLDNEELKYYFLTNNFAFDKKTIFKDVLQLRSGEVAIINTLNYKFKKIIIKTYINKKRIIEKEDTRKFKNNVLNLIKLHSRSDVKLGLAISSGIDSRSIFLTLKKNNLHNKIKKVFLYILMILKLKEMKF